MLIEIGPNLSVALQGFAFALGFVGFWWAITRN